MLSTKKEYINAEIELIYFCQGDIITSSTYDDNEDEDGWTGV